jgi:hypothetical protein
VRAAKVPVDDRWAILLTGRKIGIIERVGHVHEFPVVHVAPLFGFLAGLKRPIYSDPGKEICRCLFVDPSIDFDFVDPAQLPDLVFYLFGIHNDMFRFQVELNPIDIVQLNCSYPYSSRWVVVSFEYDSRKENSPSAVS